MARSGGPTIDEVAAAAGVSRATVSRVMNGRATVATDIAERVRVAARDLRYQPSRVARSLSLGRTNSVALVVPDLANPMFQQILRGTMAAAAPHDYRVLVAETAENTGDEAEVALEARLRCDALVLAAPRTSENALLELLPRLEPVVVINRHVPGLTVPSVRVDYAAGVRSMVDHLVALGHRELAYVAGPRSSASNALRARALDDARERHPGLRVTTVPCGPTVDAGYRAADAVLATGATGVVAFNDLVAFGLLARLNEAGVAVPGDISIGGFDDIELARYATPSLTTAAVPQADLGRRAWELLHARVLGTERPTPGDGAALHVTPGLVVRGSTGPVPPARRLGVTSADLAGRAHARDDQVRARWRAADDDWVLGIGDDRPLARYTRGASMPGVHSPRPFLHPVHSLQGVAMTAKSPVDHRHHYGVSMAVADVDGTSHWGGRTYVRDQGPTLLANHGRQEVARTEVTDGGSTLSQGLRWLDERGGVQLTEERRLTAVVLPEVDAWALGWHGSLHAGDADVEIGSPATNGRPGAGYGGWFWRLPSGDEAVALSPDRGGDVHGSRNPWVAVVRRSGSAWTTLVLAQVSGEPDPWFARVGDYVGLGPALAWDAVRKVPAGSSLEVDVVAAVVDRRLDIVGAGDVADLAVARVGAARLP
ncbi:DUF6807 family protein [Krasilnikoviella flava]|uniref:Transcriptional regulator, LacI family n=1 Tax=Krasilnikoviella flava TaxID=526729 RepID=A0A1T5J239_9MICO|nr:DUF6807 family protein [Krasilnikoviella flava]SKC45577.1 transcriptional regulator, LacI family [Krasilnikoviella flava]